MYLPLFIALIALATLITLSQKTVKILSRLSTHYNLSGTFIGLTIFSIATSLPEIISAIVASTRILTKTLPFEVTSNAVVAGNVGSDVFQQTIILGLVALVSTPFLVKKITIKHALIPLLFTSLLLFILSYDGMLSRLDGLFLLLLYSAYLYWLYITDSRQTPKHKTSKNPIKDWLYLTSALIILIISAHILFIAIQDVVQLTGIGASLIGVLVLGLGAASPELAAALTAAKEKEHGISIGILLGSNITNPALGLGLGALISTYSISSIILNIDILLKILVPLALLVLFSIQKQPKINKFVATTLILTYLVYIAVRIHFYGFQ